MIPDGGGGARGPFEHYSVSAETVWRMGDEVAAFAGDVESLDADVLGAHRPAQYGVAGMLEDPMLGAPEPVRQRAADWMRAALFSGAAIRLFGDAIEAYNNGIDDLNRRFWAGYNNSFGVADPVIAADATAAEQAAATDAHGDAVASARAATLSGLEAERAALEATLDAAAAETSDLLARGPGDEAAVLRLYQSGAMNLAAPYAFPGVNFGSIDPLRLFENIVPAQAQSMTADQLFEWMQAHPEMANVAALLLMVADPTTRQITIMQALGRYDAWVAGQAMRGGPGAQALSGLAAGTQRMRDINARIAGGRAMAEGEEAYLDAWFDEFGADNLAAVYDLVHDSVDEAVFGGVPQSALGSAAGPMRDSANLYLAPIADSIMNLSHLREFTAMPQAVQDLIMTRPGFVAGDQRYANGAWETQFAYEDMYDGIAGLDRYNGIANLLSTSTVDGSDDFTVVLAQSAITVRQDLNLIVEAGFYETDMYGERQNAIQLEQLADDSGASTMLSVVSRNEDASAAVLTDDEMRPLLLGLNWDNGAGAALVVAGGTDRTPDGGGGGEAQAEAALQVMLEVGADRDGYLEVMSAPVKSAVIDMGVTWVDTFGRETSSTNAVFDGPNDLRDRIIGIHLKDKDMENFLEFTAGVGGDDFVRFRAGAIEHSHNVLVEALHRGEPSLVNAAITTAGRIDGALTQADFEYRYDAARSEIEQIRAAEEAAANRAKGVATGLHIVNTLATTAANAASGGSTAPFLAAASPVTNHLIDSVTSGIGQPDFSSAEAEANEEQRIAELISRLQHEAPSQQHYFLANAYRAAGVPLDLVDPQWNDEVFVAGPDRDPVNLLPYDDIEHKTLVEETRDRAETWWENNAAPGRGDILWSNYDTGWESAANLSSDRYEADNPTWSDDDRRRELGYGANASVVAYDAHELDDPGGPSR